MSTGATALLVAAGLGGLYLYLDGQKGGRRKRRPALGTKMQPQPKTSDRVAAVAIGACKSVTGKVGISAKADASASKIATGKLRFLNSPLMPLNIVGCDSWGQRTVKPIAEYAIGAGQAISHKAQQAGRGIQKAWSAFKGTGKRPKEGTRLRIGFVWHVYRNGKWVLE